MITAAWNTKRGYSDKGQRIAAGILDDGRILFADVDRHIYGQVTRQTDIPPADLMLREFVMAAYDFGDWRDADSPGLSPEMDSLFNLALTL